MKTDNKFKLPDVLKHAPYEINMDYFWLGIQCMMMDTKNYIDNLPEEQKQRILSIIEEQSLSKS